MSGVEPDCADTVTQRAIHAMERRVAGRGGPCRGLEAAASRRGVRKAPGSGEVRG